MTARYHINAAGEPGLCRAQGATGCPFGNEIEHHSTPEAARSAYEVAMAAAVVPAPQAYRPKLPEIFYHVTLAENVESIRAQGLLPRIGDRSQVIGETAERVYLFDTRASAHDALYSWLGDEFEDDELVLLSVPAAAVREPTPSFPEDEESFEWTSTSRVPGDWFTVEPDKL